MAENYVTYDLVSNIAGKAIKTSGSNTDLNDIQEVGYYRVHDTVTSNLPTNSIAVGNGFLINQGLSGSFLVQTYVHYNGYAYIRTLWSGTWYSWRSLN